MTLDPHRAPGCTCDDRATVHAVLTGQERPLCGVHNAAELARRQRDHDTAETIQQAEERITRTTREMDRIRGEWAHADEVARQRQRRADLDALAERDPLLAQLIDATGADLPPTDPGDLPPAA